MVWRATADMPGPKSNAGPLTVLRAAGVDEGLRALREISNWISSSMAQVVTEERQRLETLEAAVGLRDVPDRIKRLCKKTG